VPTENQTSSDVKLSPDLLEKLSCPNVKKYSIEKLKPHPKNPRMIDDATIKALAKSIAKQTCYEIPVFNIRSGMLVTGHQRVKALKSLGAESCHVNEMDLSEDEHLLIMVSANNPGLSGKYTGDASELISHLRASDLDIDGIMLENLEEELIFATSEWAMEDINRFAGDETDDPLPALIKVMCEAADKDKIKAIIIEHTKDISGVIVE